MVCLSPVGFGVSLTFGALALRRSRLGIHAEKQVFSKLVFQCLLNILNVYIINIVVTPHIASAKPTRSNYNLLQFLISLSVV